MNFFLFFSLILTGVSFSEEWFWNPSPKFEKNSLAKTSNWTQVQNGTGSWKEGFYDDNFFSHPSSSVGYDQKIWKTFKSSSALVNGSTSQAVDGRFLRIQGRGKPILRTDEFSGIKTNLITGDFDVLVRYNGFTGTTTDSSFTGIVVANDLNNPTSSGGYCVVGLTPRKEVGVGFFCDQTSGVKNSVGGELDKINFQTFVVSEPANFEIRLQKSKSKFYAYFRQGESNPWVEINAPGGGVSISNTSTNSEIGLFVSGGSSDGSLSATSQFYFFNSGVQPIPKNGELDTFNLAGTGPNSSLDAYLDGSFEIHTLNFGNYSGTVHFDEGALLITGGFYLSDNSKVTVKNGYVNLRSSVEVSGSKGLINPPLIFSGESSTLRFRSDYLKAPYIHIFGTNVDFNGYKYSTISSASFSGDIVISPQTVDKVGLDGAMFSAAGKLIITGKPQNQLNFSSSNVDDSVFLDLTNQQGLLEYVNFTRVFLAPGDSMVARNSLGTGANSNRIYSENYETNWKFKKNIRISTGSNGANLSANLTNYPLAIRISQANGDLDFSELRPDARDLRFVSDDDQQLPYEIEEWSSGNGVVWVLIPSVQKALDNQIIRMYWGNSNAPRVQNPRVLWEPNYLGVWHLTDTLDATLKGQTAHKIAAGNPANSPGRVGGSMSFNGNGDLLRIYHSQRMDLNPSFTMSFWAQYSSPTFDKIRAIVGKNSKDLTGWSILAESSSSIKFWNNTANSALSWTSNNWFHVNFVLRFGDFGDLYINGNKLSTTTPFNEPTSTLWDLVIGGSGDPTNSTWNGKLDEFRLSNSLISPDWIKFDYLTQKIDQNVVTIDPTLNIPPSNLQYSKGSSHIYVRGAPIAPNILSSNGSPLTSVSGNLPPGLILNPVTGEITGTPTEASVAKSYVITGTNVAGSANITLTITVLTDNTPPKLGHTNADIIPLAQIAQLKTGLGTISLNLKVVDEQVDSVHFTDFQYWVNSTWKVIPDAIFDKVIPGWGKNKYASVSTFLASPQIKLQFNTNNDFFPELKGQVVSSTKFRFRAVDREDTSSYVETDFLRIDNEFPSVTFSGLITGNKSPSLSFKTDEPLSKLELLIGGRTTSFLPVKKNDTTWVIEEGEIVPPLEDGEYSINIVAVDTFQNQTRLVSPNKLVINTSLAKVTVQKTYSQKPSPALRGTVSINTATVSLIVAGKTYPAAVTNQGVWSINEGVLSNLPEGVYDVKAQATVVGGISTDETTNELVIDKTKPSIVFTPILSNKRQPTLIGKVSELDVSIRIGFDQPPNAQATLTSDKNWTLESDKVPVLTEKIYGIRFTVIDSAGNRLDTTVSNSLQIDYTPPQIRSVSPKNIKTSLNPSITMEFNEDVYINSGNLVILDSNKILVQEVNPISTNVSGWGGKFLNVNLPLPLLHGQKYYVRLNEQFLKDKFGNSNSTFGGDTTWCFNTVSLNEASLDSISIINNKRIYGVGEKIEFSLSFSQDVNLKGDGNFMELPLQPIAQKIPILPFQGKSTKIDYTVKENDFTSNINFNKLELKDQSNLTTTLGGGVIVVGFKNSSTAIIDGVKPIVKLISPTSNSTQRNIRISYDLNENCIRGAVRVVPMNGETVGTRQKVILQNFLTAGIHTWDLDFSLEKGVMYRVSLQFFDIAENLTEVSIDSVQIANLTQVRITPSNPTTGVRGEVELSLVAKLNGDSLVLDSVEWRSGKGGSIDSKGLFTANDLKNIQVVGCVDKVVCDSTVVTVSEFEIKLEAGGDFQRNIGEKFFFQVPSLPDLKSTVVKVEPFSHSLQGFNVYGYQWKFQPTTFDKEVSLKYIIDTTSVEYRTKGFPSIFRVLENQQISRLPFERKGDTLVLKSLFIDTFFVGYDTLPPSIDSLVYSSTLLEGDSLDVFYQVTDNVLNSQIYLKWSVGGGVLQSQLLSLPKGKFTIPKENITPKGFFYELEVSDEVNLTKSGPKNISINLKNVPIPDFVPSIQKYQLFSIPYRYNSSTVSSVIGKNLWGNIGQDWRLFDYNSKKASEFSEYIGGDSLIPGKGYWIFAKKFNLPYDFSHLTATTISPATSVTVPLNKGWNFIGNPFGFEVTYNQIVQENGNVEIWGKTKEGDWQILLTQAPQGSFNSAVKPWYGYALWNGIETPLLSKFKIPGYVKPLGTLKKGSNESKESGVGIRVEWAGGRSSMIYCGYNSPISSNTIQGTPLLKMDSEPTRIQIVHPSTSEKYQSLRYPNSTEGYRFPFQVLALGEKKSILSATMYGQIPHGMKAVIYDRKNQKMYSEEQFKKVEVLESDFDLMVGTPDWIEKQKVQSISIPSIHLGLNYPNPFKDLTTIPYTVPGEVLLDISIDVLNLQGQIVAELIRGKMNPGNYTYLWNGAGKNGVRLRGGVYIYQFKAPGFAPQQKRLVLLP